MIILTLSHLRSALARALTHPENAAIARLPESERTVEGLARAYLPRDLWCRWSATKPGVLRRHTMLALEKVLYANDPEFYEPYVLLDLTDPGTAHAARTALALALGLDPGPAGLCAAWRPLYATEADGRRRVGWWLSCDDDAVYFLATALAPGDDDEIVNDTIASEPDPIKALSLALLRVLGGSDVR